MLSRVLLYSLLVAAIAGFFFFRRAPQAAPVEQPAVAYPTLAEQVVRRDAEVHRLSPDTRFLDAAGEIERAITGRAGSRASATFESGGWTIRSGERQIARVSEFPSHAELHHALTGWARTLGAPDRLAEADAGVSPGTAAVRRRAHAAIEGALGALHAVRAADLADRAWSAGHRDPATARLGARALAWMMAQCFDQAGAGEALAARALAWSAIATACDSAGTRRDVALLAHALGYPAGAVAAASQLAADDPIRLAALREDEVLDAIASRGAASGGARVREARWLALRRTVERRDLEGWEVASARGLDQDTVLALPLLSSQLALGRFETDVLAAARLLLVVGSDLRLNDVASAPIAAIEERTMADGMEMFETLLEAMPESADGAFLDRDVLRGWYRAAFYSSLMGIGEHLRNDLSSVEAVREFSASLGDGSEGPEPAREFARWYANLAAYKAAGKRNAAMKADLSGMKHFGAGPRLQTWEAIRDGATWGDPFRRECARYLSRRLDSRPEQLDAWGRAVMFDLYELSRGEVLLGASVAASHPRDLGDRGWWAAYRGDRRTLDRLLADPRHRPDELAWLLRSLRVMTPEDSIRLDAVSERLVGECPDDWAIVGSYVRHLEQRHRTERVRALCSAWLARPDRSLRALEDVDARNRLARACLEEGRIEEGYQAIRSAVSSWQQGAMSLGAELLDRRGQGAEAETLAMLAWQRYPDSDFAQALLTDLFWRHGKYELAAHALRSAESPMSARGWQHELGPRFARFQRERPKEAAKAVNALIGAGLGDWRRAGLLVPALAAAGRSGPAAELAGRFAPGNGFDAEITIATWGHLKDALGAVAAGAWLERQLPIRDPRQATLLHAYAYRDRRSELLWQMPLTSNAIGHAEYQWLLRAAAMVRDSVGTPEQRAELANYYAVPSQQPYRHFGRMLLGLEPVDSVLALRLEPRAESEACYYIGVSRQAAGDIAAAADWYARCLAVGIKNNGEHHWAMYQLLEWVARNRSIERLTRESGKAPRAVAAPAI